MIESEMIRLFDWGETIRPGWVAFVVVVTALSFAAGMVVITSAVLATLLLGLVMAALNLSPLWSFLLGVSLTAIIGCWYHALYNQREYDQ